MKDIFNWSKANNSIGFLLTSSEYQNFALSATRILMFKHKIKEYVLYKIRQKDNNIYLYI